MYNRKFCRNELERNGEVGGLNRNCFKSWPKMTVILVTVLLGLAVTAEANPNLKGPGNGQSEIKDNLNSADVLARLLLVQQGIELIRFEMGKSKAPQIGQMATNAYPHEVYFQAVTLFLKADRLALELTGSTGLRPEPVPPSNVRPFHIWTLVNAAYARILTVVQELGIPESLSEKRPDPSTTPTDVGRAIVRTNRQLNLLLQRPFFSSDVFQQVSLAIRYATGLLAQFPGTTHIPPAPTLERGKRPTDVFLRLIECYTTLELIAQHANLNILHLDAKAAREAVKRQIILPSDVYDLATLLVSDLSYLHGSLQNPQPPPASVPYPGRTFPSQVYQHAGLLLNQLKVLEQKVKASPKDLFRQPEAS